MCELFFDDCFFVLYFNFLGMIIGFLIKYIGGENRVSITQPNCTITSATKKLYISAVNGSKYSYTLTGEVMKANDDQGSELEQKVHIAYNNSTLKKKQICASFIVLSVVGSGSLAPSISI